MQQQQHDRREDKVNNYCSRKKICFMYSIWNDFRIRLLLVVSGPSIRLLGGAYLTATRPGQSARSEPTNAQPRLYKPGNVLTVHIPTAATAEGRTTKLYEAPRARRFDDGLHGYEYLSPFIYKSMREEIAIQSIVTSFYSFTGI